MSMCLALFILVEKGKPSRVYKVVKNEVIIGRDEAADFSLPNVSVSRHHAKVTKSVEGWTLQDLKSSNGTMVNGRKIRDHMLASRDEIQIGKFRMVYWEDEVVALADGGQNVDQLPTYHHYSEAPSGGTINVSPAEMRKIWTSATAMQNARVVSESNADQIWYPGEHGTSFGRAGAIVVLGFWTRGKIAEITWENSTHILHRRSFFATIRVNGTKIGDNHLLRHGDQLQVGRSRFRYEIIEPTTGSKKVRLT